MLLLNPRFQQVQPRFTFQLQCGKLLSMPFGPFLRIPPGIVSRFSEVAPCRALLSIQIEFTLDRSHFSLQRANLVGQDVGWRNITETLITFQNKTNFADYRSVFPVVSWVNYTYWSRTLLSALTWSNLCKSEVHSERFVLLAENRFLSVSAFFQNLDAVTPGFLATRVRL